MQRKTVKPAAAKNGKPRKTATARPKNILTAGIRALSDAHGEAIARQGRVFESLLGLGAARDAEAPIGAMTPAPDPFGFRKFEDVFDQRVARSLQHLDVPTSTTFDELKSELERLQARVLTLEAQARER